MSHGKSICVWFQSPDRVRLREGVDMALMALAIDIPVSICLVGAALGRLNEELGGTQNRESGWYGPLRSLRLYGVDVIHAEAGNPDIVASATKFSGLALQFLDLGSLRELAMEHELWYRV